jgi:hypothetical protein
LFLQPKKLRQLELKRHLRDASHRRKARDITPPAGFGFQIHRAAVGPENNRRERTAVGVQQHETVGLRGERNRLDVGQLPAPLP